jgi:hypothetical protein
VHGAFSVAFGVRRLQALTDSETKAREQKPSTQGSLLPIAAAAREEWRDMIALSRSFRRTGICAPLLGLPSAVRTCSLPGATAVAYRIIETLRIIETRRSPTDFKWSTRWRP